MKTESGDYSVRILDNQQGVVIAGVLRLLSPSAYEPVFDPIRKELEKATGNYAVDIADLIFLNSSGVTGLSRLVLLARSHSRGIDFIVSETVPWQKKTMTSLQRLNPKVTVRTR